MKILVIDDSATARALTIKELSNIGYSDIIQAVDGTDGFEKLKNNPDVEVIFLDQEMPHMTGLEFLKKLRQELKRTDIPVALVTTLDDADFKLEAAMNPDLDYFINKPVNNQSLIRFFSSIGL